MQIDYFKQFTVIFILSLLLFSSGCSKKNSELLLSEPDQLIENSESENESENTANENAEDKTVTEETAADETSQTIMVYVCGAVRSEGVYELDNGSRVIDAVTAAGGFDDSADTSYVNQAQILEDGVKLKIPTKEETLALIQEDNSGAERRDDNNIGIVGSVSESQSEASLCVNINTADEALLCEIPGIGPSRARSIIAYRNEHGRFASIEDIMNVSGIKEKFFAKIKDHITV